MGSSQMFGNHEIRQRVMDRNVNMNCIIQPVNGRGGLYLGDIESARNTYALAQYGITSVLTVLSSRDVTYNGSINQMFIRADDAPYVSLERHFSEAIQFIDQERTRTNVLVHCYAGISRSTTMVAAYLMSQYGWTLDKAMRQIQNARPQANPNPGFIKQLQMFEQSQYPASRTGGRQQSTSSLRQSQSRPFQQRYTNDYGDRSYPKPEIRDNREIRDIREFRDINTMRDMRSSVPPPQIYNSPPHYEVPRNLLYDSRARLQQPYQQQFMQPLSDFRPRTSYEFNNSYHRGWYH